MRSRRLLAAAVFAAAALGVGASGALAGDVKGPPTGGAPNDNINYAARYHANSFCAFSGLNDFQEGQGQLDKPTQTPADGPPGAPGHGIPGTPFENGCVGFTNPYNPPS
jgi:hypothetical protein